MVVDLFGLTASRNLPSSIPLWDGVSLWDGADRVLEEACEGSPKGVPEWAWEPTLATGLESKLCFDARGDQVDLIDADECEEEMPSRCLANCEEEQDSCNIYEKKKINYVHF